MTACIQGAKSKFTTQLPQTRFSKIRGRLLKKVSSCQNKVKIYSFVQLFRDFTTPDVIEKGIFFHDFFKSSRDSKTGILNFSKSKIDHMKEFFF